VTSTRNTGALAAWMQAGACIDRPYLLEGAVTTALALCGGCPVRVDCLEWVLGLPEAEDPDHVCAGLTARQRGALRKERAAPKWCAGCEQELPAARFDRHARALDGLRSRCKDCENERQKAHRAAKRAATKECVACRAVRPASEFHIDGRMRDGLRSWCRGCEDEPARAAG
jgi:hypothetical protein